jgi:hypothetical protein
VLYSMEGPYGSCSVCVFYEDEGVELSFCNLANSLLHIWTSIKKRKKHVLWMDAGCI